MKLKLVLGVALSIFSGLSYADCISYICQNVYVDKLYTNTSGIVYVATSGDETKLDCNAESNVYLTFNLSDPAGDVYYSTLLAAQISDRKVSIRIVNGSQGCKIAYITHDRQ
ncbi:hypothetical protein J2X32_003120 [Rheinheimera pacifica]|uniref:hypothetical protein n=1 Tax=Rheinheimera pacifica TaxID=173990 RepID=UPI00285838E1|nr:hypothetical protein [Rheinheimera pacifica]MDR6984476.1 hypothetical protein [Rheinheimera pacifica]